jgi:hypothetical protein
MDQERQRELLALTVGYAFGFAAGFLAAKWARS